MFDDRETYSKTDCYRLNRNGSDSTRRALFARNMSATKNSEEESK
jgi:hypothetical protein